MKAVEVKENYDQVEEEDLYRVDDVCISLADWTKIILIIHHYYYINQKL